MRTRTRKPPRRLTLQRFEAMPRRPEGVMPGARAMHEIKRTIYRKLSLRFKAGGGPVGDPPKTWPQPLCQGEIGDQAPGGLLAA
jgi:hypothetical protein